MRYYENIMKILWDIMRYYENYRILQDTVHPVGNICLKNNIL